MFVVINIVALNKTPVFYRRLLVSALMGDLIDVTEVLSAKLVPIKKCKSFAYFLHNTDPFRH